MSRPVMGGRPMSNILDFLSCQEIFKAKGPHEWAGPCPDCGGRDRFLVWPDRPRGGAFLCRGCGAKGDGIQFLRQFHGMNYADACKTLGLTPRDSRASSPAKPTTRHTPGTLRPVTVPTPKAAELPPAPWMERGAAFLTDCQRGLETDVETVLTITGRYLTPDTARACALGWNPADRYERREAWGLPAVEGRDKLLLPRGLVIATRRRAGITALTVRCLDDRPEGRPKYWQVAGSSNVPFVAGCAGLPVVLVESALDAALVRQEAGDLCAAVAFMGNLKGLDAATDAFIKAAPLIIAAPDNDAGGRAAWQRWKQAFPSAVCAPAVGGKDVGEMHAAALRLEAVPTVREWAESIFIFAKNSRLTGRQSIENQQVDHKPISTSNNAQEAA